ncbi:MAG: DUF2520 domain-containing protein [Dehalococcoidia bacterium]|nr:DUF2520 domain-containing protein [Dehalococcoidia bacterium]
MATVRTPAAGGKAAVRCPPVRGGAILSVMTGDALRFEAIGVIGAGRLGGSLAAALRAAGHPLVAVASARLASAEALAAELAAPPVEALTVAAAVARCDLLFLTVPDAAIGPLAAALPWRAGQSVAHCCGAHTLHVLAPAAARGARTGCLHPLQSFPTRTGDPARFRGTTCGVEGAEPLGDALEALARSLGADVVRLDGVDRALYHAAAIFASNCAIALLGAAARSWARAGLPPAAARPALAPLLQGAAANAAAHELRDALTGPLARGDTATVAAHLAALAADPPARELYRRLALELLALDPPALDPPHGAEARAGLVALLAAARE